MRFSILNLYSIELILKQTSVSAAQFRVNLLKGKTKAALIVCMLTLTILLSAVSFMLSIIGLLMHNLSG